MPMDGAWYPGAGTEIAPGRERTAAERGWEEEQP